MPQFGTFELLANVTRDELSEIAYCKTLLASNFVPAWKPVALGRFFIGFEGFGDAFFHEPLTGLLTLRPNIFRRGFWSTDDYEADKLTLAAFNFTAGEFRTDYPQVIDSVASSPVVQTMHGNTSGAIDPLAGLASLTVHGSTGGPPAELLAGGSAADYCYALQTLRTWATNEGFAFQLTNNDLAMASVFPSHIFYHGRYAILLGTAGRAEIWRNEHDDDVVEGEPDQWRLVSNLDYSSSIDGKNMQTITVAVLPISERRLAIYIGPGMANASWVGAAGGADTSPAKRYLIDVSEDDLYDEATEIPEDPQRKNGIYRILEPSKITVACLKLAQFSLGFYRIRFPSTAQTLHLAQEDLGQLYGTTPVCTAYGTINRGSADITPLNEDGTAWDPLTDRKMVAEIEMTPGAGLATESASGEAIYTPEIHFASFEVEPVIAEVERTQSDWTQLWERMTINRGVWGPASMEFDTVLDESFYDWRRKHSYPVKLTLRDDYSGSDYALFAGTVMNVKAFLYSDKPKLTLMCVDGWQQLRESFTWDSPVWDGIEAYVPLRWCLNNAGVPDSRIYVSESALTKRLSKPQNPMQYTYRAAQGEDLESQAQRILDAGLDITMRERHAENGWTAIDGETELTTEDYVWVIDVRPVFVDEEATPVVAKFWLDIPNGTTWAADSTRMTAPGGDLKLFEGEMNTYGPIANILTIDCPSSSGRDARRHTVANIKNFDSIDDANHRDYTGRPIRKYMPAATHGAKGPQDLNQIARTVEEDELHMREDISAEGEWRPWILEDTFVEVYARNTVTGFIEKQGIYRVAEVAHEAEFASLSTGVYAKYVLQWEAEGEAYTDPNGDS